MKMEIKAKQRLIGALVLLAIVAIFLPLLFHNPRPSTGLTMTTTIPPAPDKPVVQLQLPPSAPPPVETPLLQTNTVDLTPKQPIVQPSLPPVMPVPQPKKVVKVNKPHSLESLLSKTPTAWIIQVASFVNPDYAKHLLQQLRAKGFDAYLQESHEGKVITRVFIGPEINRDKINKIQKELKQQMRLNGVIKKYYPVIPAKAERFRE
ncbi:SPOR domain-containing protein [Coxiella burnetii]|uniref:SPOR domain-containing protein n=1 Tax=Coxiella burnetii TaxID=777 RepID=UPI00037E8515|nr:SPOR domain-containing protein [Coxiella burnetii]AZV75808.1 sporulation protein [Coxiella burnetii]PNT87278.1 sporulation protein [Coxiella burnetii]RQM63148.1 sporulation protein [Coxiella burnetii]RQM69006.1 sporulation protein [Coxiella burnetii]RQM82253.1 sporulation protein [Coxiella burnetii]